MIRELQPLIQRSVVRSYSSGSIIVHQGEVPRAACVLVSGTVKVLNISDQGDEQIVAFHMAGEFFPSSWIFKKSVNSLFFYEAAAESTVAFIDRSELTDFMLAEPSRTRALVDYFATNHSASLVHINALEQSKARGKLLYTLYYLAQRYGIHKGSKVRIPFTLTHQELANLIGLTRETVATEMHKLKQEGLLTYRNQKYIIAINRLYETMGEDNFRNLNIGVESAALSS